MMISIAKEMRMRGCWKEVRKKKKIVINYTTFVQKKISGTKGGNNNANKMSETEETR